METIASALRSLLGQLHSTPRLELPLHRGAGAQNKYPLTNSAQAIRKGEAATTRIDKNGVNRAAMFRFNPGKQKVIFPDNHLYFKVSQEVKEIVGALQTAPVIK